MPRRPMLAAALFLAAARPAPAQTVLYADNFDAGTSASAWTATASPAAAAAYNTANFAFNYSSVGIPAAPNSVGGTTVGLQLQANRYRPDTTANPGVFSGVSASPNGQSFAGDYTLRFDAWQNFTGPFPAGGSGSTQMTGGGIGAQTAVAQFPGGAVNGVYVAASGDGGTGTDYRAYVSPGAPLAETSGAYAAGALAGSTNNTNAYYANNQLGSVQAPAAQLDLFPSQTGATAAGTLGMEWHTWTVRKAGNTVTWSVTNRDGVDVAIATFDVTNEPFAGDNIFVGQFDINATPSADPNSEFLQFGLIDNVVVFTPVPEPAGLLAVAGLALPVWLRRRRPRIS